MQEKMKELESHKDGYFSSVKGFFGFGKKSVEEEETEKRHREEAKEKLEKEALHNI